MVGRFFPSLRRGDGILLPHMSTLAMNTYNNDIIMGNSNTPRINIHNKRSSNEMVTLQKETDTESSTIINE